VLFGSRRKPILSAGTSGERARPKIIVNADGEMRNLTSANTRITWIAIDTASGR
jgi:hypothetical protein